MGVTAPEFVATRPLGQVVVAEITVCTDSLGSLRTFYFSSGLGWVTTPSDTPASTYIAPGLINAGGYKRSMFAGRALFGAMQASFGAIEISNADKKLDEWVDYAFDGRPIKLWVGQEGAAFPGGFTRVVTTDLLGASISPAKVTLSLRDPMHLLSRPIVRERFTGAGGLEGPANLTGQPKPRCAGGTHFTPMILVDASSWIYMVCTDATLPIGSTVYAGGIAVTQGAAYSSTADLISTAPSTGEARVYFGGPTYVRFASEPAGEPTITRLAGIGSGLVMATLAAEAGLVTHGTHISGPVMGAYVDDSRTSYLEVFARESLQTPKWFGLDRDGLFVVRDVSDPASGTSVATITAHDKLQINRSTPDGLDVPLWRVTARGDRNWSRDRTLAAGALAAARQDYGNSSTASDASVLTRHPLAGELALEIGNDPGVTAAAHLALHSADRFVWRVAVDLRPEWVEIDLGDVVTLQHHRLQLADGKKLLVVGVDIELASQRLAFSLWG